MSYRFKGPDRGDRGDRNDRGGGYHTNYDDKYRREVAPKLSNLYDSFRPSGPRKHNTNHYDRDAYYRPMEHRNPSKPAQTPSTNPKPEFKPDHEQENGRHSHHGNVQNHTRSPLQPPTPNSVTSAPEEVTGTDPRTGVNPHDLKVPTLQLHRDHLQLEFSSPSDPPKNYKVLYDPENDSHRNKSTNKSKSKVFRFNGSSVSDPQSYSDAIIHSSDITDPRKKILSTYFSKPNKNSKKFPFKQLPQPRFVFDKNSVGPPPQTELVVWDIPSTTSEVYVTNFFRSHGNATEINFLQDPMYAVPLGVMLFRFQGSPDKSMLLAKNLLNFVHLEKPKINGVVLKIELNDHEGKLLRSKVEIAQNRIRQSKQKLEMEEQKRREMEEEKKRKEIVAQREEARQKESQNNTFQKYDYKPNTTIMSVKYRNKVIPGTFLPREVRHIIKDNPYLFIHDKHVSTRTVSAQDIKRVLNKYNWSRVLHEKVGFFIIFNSLEECKRCFWKEDGRRFYEFRMFMEMAVPEGFEDKSTTSATKGDAVEEATNMLIQEFQAYLKKDIRERVIAPQVLELLNPERFPVLKAQLDEERTKQAQAAAARAETIASKIQETRNKEGAYALMNKKEAQLPSCKRKEGIKMQAKKRVIPMQHVLNYENDSDDSEDDSSRSATPAPALKRERSLPATSYDEEAPSKKKKKTLLKTMLLYDSSEGEVSDSPEDQVMEDAEEAADQVDDFADVDVKFRPTLHSSVPVYPEDEFVDEFDVNYIQSSIKDEEDLNIAKSILSELKPSTIANVDYWAWKQKETRKPEEIAESVHLIEPLAPKFESASGSFRSEGYRKIPDTDKIEYLPHRRKIYKPVKTVQHEDDETSANNGNGTNNSTAVHSSRVNRANNRRLVADISAQKQMLGSETDILDLNALTKRKKPVTFARSAIHNWGLYALESIAAKEMIIEYVGESIRQQVAEHREKSYLKTGIGSSYLFRIDENSVIDATKKGGIARFINHCCNPSCTAKIIKVEGKKRIVIYALRDIEANEELTYDYKFERETNDDERIRCLCGAPGCKGYLN